MTTHPESQALDPPATEGLSHSGPCRTCGNTGRLRPAHSFNAHCPKCGDAAPDARPEIGTSEGSFGAIAERHHACRHCGKAYLVRGVCPVCLLDRHGNDPALADGHGANTPTSKDTNPKDAVAVAHLKFSALPMRTLAGPALALSEGAYKYGRHNYRAAGVKASVYFDAAMDHLLAWYEGEDIDPASGLHHLDKLLAGIMVLRDAQLGGMCSDDRPPAVATGWIEDGHARTAELFKRMRETHGEPKALHVRVALGGPKPARADPHPQLTARDPVLAAALDAEADRSRKSR